MNWNGKKFIFTTHALDRLKEFGVNFNKSLKIFSLSSKEKLSKADKQYKKRKYSGNQDVFYTRYNEYVFAVRDMGNIYLILTATNQLINLKY